jgi:hypothetical protein
MARREVQHRCRAEPDPQNVAPAVDQAFDERSFQHRRGVASVKADGNALGVFLFGHAAEGASDGAGVVFVEGPSDDAADVVFAQHARIEPMRRRVGGIAPRWRSGWP